MLLKLRKRKSPPLVLTPQDYLWELQEHGKRECLAEEMEEASVQLVLFEKRTNDLHLISYREFAYDDYLTRTNLIVDMMGRQFYEVLKDMLAYLEGDHENQDKIEYVKKYICENEIMIEDLNSLFSKMLNVQEDGKKNSLEAIEDVIREMEEIYINKLTKA